MGKKAKAGEKQQSNSVKVEEQAESVHVDSP